MMNLTSYRNFILQLILFSMLTIALIAQVMAEPAHQVIANNQLVNGSLATPTNPQTALAPVMVAPAAGQVTAPNTLPVATTQVTTVPQQPTVTVSSNPNPVGVQTAPVPMSMSENKAYSRLNEVMVELEQLKLQNQNMSAQVKVLQKERSGDIFIYGALTLLTGVLFGLTLGKIMGGKKPKPW